MRWLTVLFLVASLSARAQSGADALIGLAQHYYNAGQPDSLYDRLAPTFQQQLPRSNWRSFLTQVYQQAGHWQASAYVGQRQGFALYKGFFQRDTLLVRLSANAAGQLTGFGMAPYTAPRPLRTDNPLRTPLDRQIDSLVRAHQERQAVVGLCIGLIRHDSLLAYHYGETRAGNSQLPTDLSLFEIGSVTKTFTATLLAEAIRQRKLTLDTPVNRFLPDSVPLLQRDGVSVTVGMLANHTSGLPRLPTNLSVAGYSEADPYRTYDRQALFSYLRTATLASTPGTTYAYSNLGAGLLGTLLETVLGQPYDQLVRRYLTKPLGMPHTSLHLSAADNTLLARGHNEQGQVVSNWLFQALAGGGGLRSNLRDMLRYLRAELGKAPASLRADIVQTQQLSLQRGTRQVGLGWHRRLIGAAPWWFHDGGTGGYVSFVGFSTDRQVGVVILSSSNEPIDALAIQLGSLADR